MISVDANTGPASIFNLAAPYSSPTAHAIVATKENCRSESENGMNYDHLFHAGNFADVIKHITLSLIITYLQKKQTPFRVIDSHAGSGLYDLTSPAAQKNPEWQTGIAKILDAQFSPKVSAAIAPYLNCVHALNADSLKSYPGSPTLARALLRPQDRLTAIELHPEAFTQLKAQFHGDVQVKTMHLDGYAALPAQLPPKEKRGLTLIDPPFEQADEFARLVKTLVKAHRHFAHGIYAIWYPLKNIEPLSQFKSQLHKTGIRSILASEFCLRAPSTPPRLFGTGMIIVNPPFLLKDQLDQIFREILPHLSVANSASFDNRWIRTENG